MHVLLKYIISVQNKYTSIIIRSFLVCAINVVDIACFIQIAEFRQHIGHDSSLLFSITKMSFIER